MAAGLSWLDAELGPAIARALPRDGLPVLPLVAEGIRLGDDVHQRNVGGMLAFVRALPDLDRPVRSWLFGNPQAFLNYAMAAAKLALDAADGVAGSTIVTALSRNDAACGIRMAGTGRRWFTAPASIPEGGLFAPHTPDDVQPDLGDSAIVEAFGLGGTIAHASPELAGTMGRLWDEARRAGLRMRTLFGDRHPAFSAVLLGHDGAGLGLDAARVTASGTPVRYTQGSPSGTAARGGSASGSRKYRWPVSRPQREGFAISAATMVHTITRLLPTVGLENLVRTDLPAGAACRP